MAKEKEKVQLRTVDEDAIATPRYVRLGKDMRQALRTMRVERMPSLDPLTMDKHSSFWMVACELEGGLVNPRWALLENPSGDEQ